jgi:outer membrane protein OmpA-like peptidoglycan-associated protein
MSPRLLSAAVLLLAAAAPAPAQAPTNVFASSAGARIVAFSSNYGGGWDVQNLLHDGSDGQVAVWCTEDDAPFPHWSVVELPRSTWLTTLVFNNAIVDEPGYPGISARDVQVLVSSESATSGFRPVASFALVRNQNNQEVQIEPTEARWVKILITSNWGNPSWTELGRLGAFDDGTRPADIAATLRASGSADVYGVYFDFGTAALRAESGPMLDQIAAALRADPALRLVVEGHTDNAGDAAANQRLSEQRASAVVQALAGRGIEARRLSAAGFGAARPVADNGTVVGRARNRRVTLRVPS